MPNMSAPDADARVGFFRLPKVLFLDERYRGLSAESKLLYALMLDRMGLSIRNGWADKAGRVFIYFTLEEIEKMLGCGHGKATGLCRELEKADLIERGPQVKKGRPPTDLRPGFRLCLWQARRSSNGAEGQDSGKAGTD